MNSILWRKNSLEGSSSCHILQIVSHNRFSGCTKITLVKTENQQNPVLRQDSLSETSMHGYNLFWQNIKISLIFKNPSLAFFNQPCHLAAKTQPCFQWPLRHWQKHRIMVNTELHGHHYSGVMCKPGEHYCPLVNTELHEHLVHYSGAMCKPGKHYCPSAPHFPTLCCPFLRSCECPGNRESLSSGSKAQLSGSAEGGTQL